MRVIRGFLILLILSPFYFTLFLNHNAFFNFHRLHGFPIGILIWRPVIEGTVWRRKRASAELVVWGKHPWSPLGVDVEIMWCSFDPTSSQMFSLSLTLVKALADRLRMVFCCILIEPIILLIQHFLTALVWATGVFNGLIDFHFFFLGLLPLW